MALSTYDAEVDVLYVLLLPESDAVVASTVELRPDLHVDLNPEGRVVGIEVLYPRDLGIDLVPVRERFGLDVEVPFSFAA